MYLLFYVDAEKTFLGTLNTVHRYMYLPSYLLSHQNKSREVIFTIRAVEASNGINTKGTLI